jgi:FkbM family methyltransferase
LCSDEESRQQFVNQLNFRLHLDYESLPANLHQGYFPDLLPKLDDSTIFVDCGAFDGDSIRDFLNLQNSRFARIYAFEPDELNFARLKEFVAALDPDLSRRINLYHAAVGQARTRVSFNATGNMSASLAADGEQTVDLLTLDEVVDPSDGAVFLKLDVEGAELDVLNGAQQLLREAKPLIAISVYHRPDDLWSLPLLLHSFDSDYNYYLRTQGEDGMDVICYAVPKYLGQ